MEVRESRRREEGWRKVVVQLQMTAKLGKSMTLMVVIRWSIRLTLFNGHPLLVLPRHVFFHQHQRHRRRISSPSHARLRQHSVQQFLLRRTAVW